MPTSLILLLSWVLLRKCLQVCNTLASLFATQGSSSGKQASYAFATGLEGLHHDCNSCLCLRMTACHQEHVLLYM